MTMWEWASEHPYLFTFCVMVVGQCAAVGLSGIFKRSNVMTHQRSQDRARVLLGLILQALDDVDAPDAENEDIPTDPDLGTVVHAPERIRELGRLLERERSGQEYIAKRALVLRDAVKRYVEWHGPTADHHSDECPEPGTCKPCQIDAAVNEAMR